MELLFPSLLFGIRHSKVLVHVGILGIRMRCTKYSEMIGFILFHCSQYFVTISKQSVIVSGQFPDVRNSENVIF